jgi:hypothetical protein
LKRRKCGEETVSAGFGPGRKTMTDAWGPRVGEGERGGGTDSGQRRFGPWVPFLIWAEGFPRPFSIFFSSLLLFFFLFSNSFVSFAKKLQINSNHFQEFSKIQGIKVGQ